MATWDELQEKGFFSDVEYGFPEKDFFLLKLPILYKGLSSALYGQGLVEASNVFNFTVESGYSNMSPLDDILAAKNRMLISDDSIGMMTAAQVHRMVIAASAGAKSCAAAFITLGLSNPAAAGVEIDAIYSAYKPGTINTIILVEGDMTSSALVNGITTATEAKVRALYDCRLRFADGNLLTGTTTDTIAILASGTGEHIEYAGTGTEAGYHIGKAVYEGTVEAVLEYLKKKEIERADTEILLW